MKFTMKHMNINVADIDKSVAFYEEALGLAEVNRFESPGFTIVFMGGGESGFRLELTKLKTRAEPYDLSDNEIHLAFGVADHAAAKAKHQAMGCVCYENPMMGIYFIEDPDGYWSEILPEMPG